VLTETVPENATYAGGPAWQPVGPKTYIYAAGDVPPESGNSVPFEIQVNNQVPAGTRRSTNTIETDFAPFVDAFGRTIIDPVPLDNWFQLGTDLSIFGIDVAKRADPPAGSEVNPGALITYTIAYTNTGMRAANHVLITDTFDQSGGYTVLEAVPQPNHGSNSWYFDNLRAGMSGTIQIRVQVSDPLPNHWILTNQAEMASAEGAADLPPIVTHTVTNTASGAPVPMPDLIVENLWWEPTTPTPDSTFRFYATVANVGTAAIDPSTAVVELYIKPQPSSPPAGPSDHERGFCLNNCSTVRQNFVAWLVGLAPGERQTVSFQNLEPDPTFPSPGCYDIYVQVDTSFAAPGYNPYWGYYAENYETNNLASGALCTEGSPMLYLPIIASGY
jgi:uncharacterized repeat protein (TIGR01451 family)